MYLCPIGIFSDVLSHLLLRGTVVITLFEMKEERDLVDRFFDECFALLQALTIANTRVRGTFAKNNS